MLGKREVMESSYDRNTSPWVSRHQHPILNSWESPFSTAANSSAPPSACSGLAFKGKTLNSTAVLWERKVRFEIPHAGQMQPCRSTPLSCLPSAKPGYPGEGLSGFSRVCGCRKGTWLSWSRDTFLCLSGPNTLCLTVTLGLFVLWIPDTEKTSELWLELNRPLRFQGLPLYHSCSELG